MITFFRMSISILAVLFFSIIGFFYSSKYKKRESLLADIISLCDYLISDISFMQSRLADNIRRFQGLLGEELGRMLESYCGLLDSVEMDYQALFDRIENKYLKNDEYSRFLQLLLALGTTDADTQVGTITAFRESFTPNYELARSENQRYGTMYAKLGVLIGIGVAIVLI